MINTTTKAEYLMVYSTLDVSAKDMKMILVNLEDRYEGQFLNTKIKDDGEFGSELYITVATGVMMDKLIHDHDFLLYDVIHYGLSEP